MTFDWKLYWIFVSSVDIWIVRFTKKLCGMSYFLWNKRTTCNRTVRTCVLLFEKRSCFDPFDPVTSLNRTLHVLHFCLPFVYVSPPVSVSVTYFLFRWYKLKLERFGNYLLYLFVFICRFVAGGHTTSHASYEFLKMVSRLGKQILLTVAIGIIK